MFGNKPLTLFWVETLTENICQSIQINLSQAITDSRVALAVNHSETRTMGWQHRPYSVKRLYYNWVIYRGSWAWKLNKPVSPSLCAYLLIKHVNNLGSFFLKIRSQVPELEWLSWCSNLTSPLPRILYSVQKDKVDLPKLDYTNWFAFSICGNK